MAHVSTCPTCAQRFVVSPEIADLLLEEFGKIPEAMEHPEGLCPATVPAEDPKTYRVEINVYEVPPDTDEDSDDDLVAAISSTAVAHTFSGAFKPLTRELTRLWGQLESAASMADRP